MAYGLRIFNEESGTPQRELFGITGTSAGPRAIGDPGRPEIAHLIVDSDAFSTATEIDDSEEFFIRLTGNSGSSAAAVTTSTVSSSHSYVPGAASAYRLTRSIAGFIDDITISPNFDLEFGGFPHNPGPYTVSVPATGTNPALEADRGNDILTFNFNIVAGTATATITLGTISQTGWNYLVDSNLGLELVRSTDTIWNMEFEQFGVRPASTPSTVTIAFPTEMINETIVLAPNLTTDAALASDLLTKLQANTAITSQFGVFAHTHEGNQGVRLRANDNTDHTIGFTFTNNGGDLTGSSGIQLPAATGNTSSEIRITYLDAANNTIVEDIVLGAQPNGAAIAAAIASMGQPADLLVRDSDNIVIYMDSENRSRRNPIVAIEVVLPGTSGLDSEDFMFLQVQEGAGPSFVQDLTITTDDGISVSGARFEDNSTPAQIASRLRALFFVNQETLGWVNTNLRPSETTTFTDNVVARALRNGPRTVDVTFSNGVGGDIAIAKQTLAVGDIGVAFTLDDTIQRIIATDVTGTSNGSRVHRDFDSTAGFFFLIPNRETTAEDSILPDISWNNTTKTLSWTFNAHGVNSGWNNFAPTTNASGRYFLIQTGGSVASDRDSDYGFFVRNSSGEVSIDADFQNLARANFILDQNQIRQSLVLTDDDGNTSGAVTNNVLSTLGWAADDSDFDGNISFSASFVDQGSGVLPAYGRTGSGWISSDSAALYSSAPISVRTRLPRVGYGLVIMDSDSQAVFTDQDIYPNVLATRDLANLQNLGVNSSMTVTHDSENYPFYMFTVNVNPIYRGVLTNSSRTLNLYRLAVTNVSTTQARIEWRLALAATLSSGQWQPSLNGTLSSSGAINGTLAVFRIPGYSRD